MKSRRLVRDMCEYLRAINPGLAKALVGKWAFYVYVSFGVQDCFWERCRFAVGCGSGETVAAQHSLSP